MDNLWITLIRLINLSSRQVHIFSLAGTLLILCLFLNTSMCIASTVYEAGGWCWGPGDVHCPSEIYPPESYSGGCNTSYPYACPVDWTYEVADSLDFYSSEAALSLDLANPLYVNVNSPIRLTAHATSTSVSTIYQYEFHISKFNLDTVSWEPWTLLANRNIAGDYTWDWTPHDLGIFRMQVGVRANYVTSDYDAISSIYFFDVRASTKPSILTTSIPEGRINVMYDTTLSVNGGGVPPYTWKCLPDCSMIEYFGISLSTDGRLSGIPSAATLGYDFEVIVKDSQIPPEVAYSVYRLKIYEPPEIITSLSSEGRIGTSYNQSLTATKGKSPYTWAISSGSLPSGLSLSSNGVVSGTFTSAGTFNFSIRVMDSEYPSASSIRSYTIYVYSQPTIDANPLPTGTVGSAYTTTLSASGGKPPYISWLVSTGSLPSGLILNSSTGVISGTPQVSGNFNFTVQVYDSLNPQAIATRSFTISVYLPLVLSTNTLSTGTVSNYYNQSLSATGGNGIYTWSIYSGSLPSGLSLSSAGVIIGTPQNAGTYIFTARVNDSQNPAASATKQFTIIVYPQMVIGTNTLSTGTTSSSYSQTLSATGGNGSYTWSLYTGTLPPGLSLSADGIISGTLSSTGSYTFTVRVNDGQNPAASATKQFTISVYDPLTISTGTIPGGKYGIAFSQTLSASGGNGPYSWSIISGDLPSGLNLASNGVISGTPSDIGRFSVTVQVSDTQSPPAIKSIVYPFNVTNGTMQVCTETPTVVGLEASTKVCTASTTDIMSGIVAHDQELFSTKGAALGTAIELFYKSQPAYTGPLGPGWSHTYDISLTVNNDGSIVLKDGAGNKSFYTMSGNSYISPPGDFSTLVKNGDNSYTITYRDGLRRNFRADGKLTSIVDRFSNTISFTYTGSDLTGITDQAGRVTSIAYDQSVTPHLISIITDPNNKTYDFSYQGTNCSNRLCRVTNPVADPAVSQVRGYWEYQYDAAGYLNSKRDPNGNTSQYGYYSDHRMQTATDPEGQPRSIVYPTTTGTLRTSTLTEKDDGQWLYTYDTQNGVIKEKADPNGKVTKYTYYSNGNIKSKTEPKDGTVQLTTFYTYDSYGNVLTQTEPADLSVYTSPNNDPETVTDPATLAGLSPSIKPAIRYAYDNANYDRITSVSDERVTPFITTTFTYTTENGGEVVTATTTPGNYAAVTKKYPNGTVKEANDANGKKTSFTYYPNAIAGCTATSWNVGLLCTVTDPAGVVTTITGYNANGNPTGMTVKDTAGTVRLTTSQQFDALSRLEQLTKSTTLLPNIVTQYGYDNVGNMITLVDAEQVGTTKKTSYEYRYDRKVKKITDAKLNDTIFKYSGSEQNGVDQLVGVYDANVTKNTPLDSQPHTGFNYDKLGRLDTETDQLGKKIHYTYYDNGLVKEKYDATNSIPGTLLVTYTYNNRSQVTDKIFTDGTSEHYAYKPDGKLESAANQNITYTYTYYDDGRLHTATDNNGRQISYDQYDNLGQRKQVTILKGAGADERVISYDYDAANRPWHIYNGTRTFTYAYDNLGRRDTLSYPNGTLADWGFDDLNRLTAITHKVSGGASFASFNYTVYDKVGNRKTVTGSKNETYDYDELYHLQNVASTKPEGFNYDAVGNRQNGPSPADTIYSHNAANQMTQGRKLGYGYNDNFGNQTTKTVPGASDKSWVQTWDLQNRLTKVEKIKGSEKRTVTFTYDPLGRRIGKQMVIVKDGIPLTQTWLYVYDGDNIAVEIYTDENTSTTKTFYTQGPGVDEHLAMERGGQFYYCHADGLGSIASITDANKAVVQSYEYDSYGMVTPGADFRTSYTYTGREWDPETGLYYYRARYYDPIEGRFISKDLIGIAGGLNVYAYVQNNPINFIDPFGLQAWITVNRYGDGTSGTATVIDTNGNKLTLPIFNSPKSNGSDPYSTDSQLPPGEYTVSPRQVNDAHNGRPTISNTGNWNNIVTPLGTKRSGVQIHPGSKPSHSKGCLVTLKSNYNKLKNILDGNYSDGGVTLTIIDN